jgi:hypothetical protein
MNGQKTAVFGHFGLDIVKVFHCRPLKDSRLPLHSRLLTHYNHISARKKALVKNNARMVKNDISPEYRFCSIFLLQCGIFLVSDICSALYVNYYRLEAIYYKSDVLQENLMYNTAYPENTNCEMTNW